MAALPFVGTLDSDEEVQQVDDETESEDEQTKPVKKAKKKKKGKSDVFQDGFNLFSGETEDGNKDPWNFDAAINLLKKRQISTFQTSLQDKISKRRDDKRKSTMLLIIIMKITKTMKVRILAVKKAAQKMMKKQTREEKEIFSRTTTPRKTAAYMLPILERLIYRPQNTTVTRVLVLAPTRELAIQVHSVSQALAKHTNIQICLATGGLDSKNQVALLRRGPDIVIATPGRLVDHLHNAPTFSLHTVEIIVLDEADRMLDENFQDQMEEIIKLSPGGRQTMLFSATMTDEVEELANLSLNQPVRLFVDNNTDVAYNLRQEFVRIRNNRENDRLAIVTALCSRNFDEHCLIFMQTKHSAHRLRIILGLLGLNRLEALRKFKEGQVDILVATDLASRGLDILGVKTVINTTLPPTLKQYIHRVGRTARAGQVIDKYKSKIEGLEKDVKAILKQEGEEKELRVSEMQVSKARNLIEHEKEIFSRPPRVWIQSKRDTKRKAGKSSKSAGVVSRFKAFDKELTDTSKNALKAFRQRYKRR
ncbi:putative ATP-dependent RNA helicase DDX27 [Acropora cervicornis]|uniref:ATP-dependent RNA helicase DDX27 n=1 Tax=Acropora cervicornis TaxID=6130 RepID=A0AAD9QE93_ACRCE|nr:putative ATP-dependent RNA helicase DDX27 [Acropora cervicornis]